MFCCSSFACAQIVGLRDLIGPIEGEPFEDMSVCKQCATMRVVSQLGSVV
jgi:hypothetical protein